MGDVWSQKLSFGLKAYQNTSKWTESLHFKEVRCVDVVVLNKMVILHKNPHRIQKVWYCKCRLFLQGCEENEAKIQDLICDTKV